MSLQRELFQHFKVKSFFHSFTELTCDTRWTRATDSILFLSEAQIHVVPARTVPTFQSEIILPQLHWADEMDESNRLYPVSVWSTAWFKSSPRQLHNLAATLRRAVPIFSKWILRLHRVDVWREMDESNRVGVVLSRHCPCPKHSLVQFSLEPQPLLRSPSTLHRTVLFHSSPDGIYPTCEMRWTQSLSEKIQLAVESIPS